MTAATAAMGAAPKAVDCNPVDYEVVHWINGRIRLRVPRLAHDVEFAKRVGEAAQTVPGLKDLRVSPASSSLVVTYQPDPIAAQQGSQNGASHNGAGLNANHANGNHANGHAGPSQAILPRIVTCLEQAAYVNGTHKNGAHKNGAHNNGMHANGAPAKVAPVTITWATPTQAKTVQPSAAPLAAPTAPSAQTTATAPLPQAAPLPKVALDLAARKMPGDMRTVVERLGLPTLGFALSAGALAGLALPGLLVGGVILVAAAPIFKRTIQGYRDEKRLTVDFLDSSAIVLLTLQGSFLAPAFIVWVIEGSEIVRSRTARHSLPATLDMVLAQPPKVSVERHGEVLDVAWNEIAMGDIVSVGPGEPVLVDGYIAEGGAWVNEQQLTGSATLVAYGVGEQVYASSVVVKGRLRIVAARTGTATRAAVMLALAQAAPQRDTRVSNHARKLGNPAVLPTLAAAGVVGALSGSVARATGIVSLDLGTGMRVSSPVGVLKAQAHAAQYGIEIRSGRALETLAGFDTLVIDGSMLPHVDAALVEQLQQLGRTVLLVSESGERSAQAAGARLGIAAENVYANAVPEQKGEFIQWLQEEGHCVAVVGDGINDAAALAYADVSIAFGSAADLARHTADVVLLNDDLYDLLNAIDIAQQFVHVVEQNKWIVVAPNLAGIAYGVLFVLNPIAGVVINNGSAFAAFLNSLRPYRKPTQQRLPAGVSGVPAHHQIETKVTQL